MFGISGRQYRLSYISDIATDVYQHEVVGGFNSHVADIRLLDHMEHRSRHRGQCDHLSLAGRPSVVKNTDDNTGMSFRGCLFSTR
jgi:hypothetical protein